MTWFMISSSVADGESVLCYRHTPEMHLKIKISDYRFIKFLLKNVKNAKKKKENNIAFTKNKIMIKF